MNKKIIIKIAKILLITMILFTVYCSGMTRGIILGAALSEQRHGETLCDFMGLERDTDGFCVLDIEESKYRWNKDCGYEKFKVNGETDPTFLVRIAENIRGWIYYPATGC